jgi:aminodeoxyfutalosine synthase
LRFALQLLCFLKNQKDSPHAYDWNHETVIEKAAEAVSKGARELHIVGGLHPDHPFSYYVEMLSKLRKAFPLVNLKAFTAVELCYFAKKSGRALDDIIHELKVAGLDALPGGGAEILVQSVRVKFAAVKKQKRWLYAHRAVHKAGMFPMPRCSLDILNTEQRIEHLNLLRQLQEETHGFYAFIPLVFTQNTIA